MRPLVLALVLCGLATPLARAEAPAHAPAVRVEGTHLVDAHGREVVLRGVNAGSKDPARRYQSHHTAEDYQALADWGLNCVRLLIFWDGVEPAPGDYDQDYLDLVAERIAWAHAAGLHVILDMHQDLYSGAIPGGNGAPAWAALTDDQPHVFDGGPWSTAYYTSPMVHAAFDNFWGNAPGPDGVGIQERFARAWAEVARRFKDTPGVIGYDLLNEPFMGSGVQQALQQILLGVPGLLENIPPEAMAGGMGEMLAAVLAATDDPERFPLLLAAIEGVHGPFEAGPLGDMHRRVAAAIREHDPHRIIFVQPGYMANSGAPSHVPAIVYDDGTREPQQAYAPHTYDLVVDTANAAAPSVFRLDTIFDNTAAHGAALGMPVVSGEWGAFYSCTECEEAARLVAERFDRHGMGDLYWDYHRGLEELPHFASIRRPYPVAVAGTITDRQFDAVAGTLAVAWEEDPAITAPTRVYIGGPWLAEGYTVTLTPEGAGYTHELAADGGPGHLVIPPTGTATARTLVVAPGAR